MRLIFLILLSTSLNAFGQDFVFSNFDDLVTASMETENQAYETMHVFTDVTNNTTETISVFTTFEIISTDVTLVDSIEYSYCWVNCFGPGIISSPFGIPAEPGATIPGGYVDSTQGFDGKYKSNQLGTTVIRQSFYDENEEYLSHLDFTFCISNDPAASCAVSVEDFNQQEFYLGNPYPNPSTENTTSIDYSSKSSTNEIHLYSLTGELKKTISLNSKSGTEKIDTSNLDAGVYILSLVSENGSISRTSLVIQ